MLKAKAKAAEKKKEVVMEDRESDQSTKSTQHTQNDLALTNACDGLPTNTKMIK